MQKKQHLPSLDGLRGIAAAAVVFSHMGLIFPSVSHLIIQDIGSRAVAIFFSLSGFLMAYLYGGKPISRGAVADFMVSRFSRIYPVYLVAVIVVVILTNIPHLEFINPIFGMTAIVRHIFLLGSSGVLWSVPPEIQFYILFPLIWLFFSDYRRYQIIGVLLAGFLAIIALLDFPGPGILLVSKLAFFLLGAVAGRLHVVIEKQAPGRSVGILALVLPFFVLVSAQFSPLTGSAWGLEPAFAGTLAVLLVAREHPISAMVFSAFPIRFLGKISFSLYLFHVPVMFLMANALSGILPIYIMIPAAACAALLIGWMSYEGIETPARRMLVSLWQRRKSRTAAEPTARVGAKA